MAPSSPQERELALVEKLEFRIALADSDAKLQSLLGTYLAALLLKLGSEHVKVRNKVVSICQHVKARTKPESIQLPVAALIKQFQDCADSRLIRHFDLVFIQEGFPRLQISERSKLLPVLTEGIEKLSSASAAEASTIFHLFLQALSEFSFPPKESPEDENLRRGLGLSDKDATFLSTWIGKLILLRSGTAGSVSAGLTKDEQEFLSVSINGKESAWTASTLAHAKYASVKLIGSGAFKDSERLMPALLASADANSRISDLAEVVLKRCLPEVDTGDKQLIQQLFSLYTRNETSDSASFASSVALRIKILGILSKTSSSTSFTGEIKHIVAKDLIGSDSHQGRESNKLRSAIVQLLMLVARQASATDLASISQDILASLKDFLDQQYDDKSSPELTDLRGRSFEVIGLLASADTNELLEPELRLLRWLFRCLSEERNKQVVLSISEALSMCIRPFQTVNRPEVTDNLRNLFLETMSVHSLSPGATLHSILRFANRCLPVSDVVARWINISVLGSKQRKTYEITEEAQKGLDPYWLKLSREQTGQISLPSFPQMASFLLKNNRLSLKDLDLATTAIRFCRQCLLCWCMELEEQPFEFSVDWKSKLDVAMKQDRAARLTVRTALRKQAGSWDLVMDLFQLSCESMANENKNRAASVSVILELVSVSPRGLLEKMAPRFSSLQPGLLANDFDTRVQSAQAFGLLASHPANTDDFLSSSLNQLFDVLETRGTAVGAGINRVHGALSALGHFASRRYCWAPTGSNALENSKKLLAVALEVIITSSDALIRDAAYRALGQLSVFSAIMVEDVEQYAKLDAVVEKISKIAKEGNDIAILTLGHLSVMLDDSTSDVEITTLLDQMHSFYEIRQPETQFAVGEAFTILGSGWESTAMQSQLLVDGLEPKARPRATALSKVVNKVLEDCKSTKPALKKASVIWLLCLIQFCGHQNEVQQHLRAFQAAFKRCLSDRDELVQESASRGLGLVYEKGDRALKDELVHDLVSSFSSSKADMSGTVDADTQLFEPGALPTGDGSVSTYKDIMSLASEVGDPSLVYRFMSLASNNAIWSNRAAFGRFGLSNVLSDSSVDGYLANNPKMYPALYRYRFDPNSNVRRSMNEIWNALIRDPVTTVNDHLDLIVTDLLKNMIGREWRTRQASCAALADLLQGRQLSTIQKYLDETWSRCFKVLDDIKETVRKEASGLARVLTNILINNLESSEGKTDVISELLKSVLPFLLSTQGIEAGADEVKLFSLRTLLDIVKRSKPAMLRPFLPDLIAQLILLLTSFEPDAVNYIAMNASNYNLTQSDIDQARLNFIRSSPIMEAVERALDMLDEETMGKAMPKLLEAMRQAVGEPSKVGCSRVLVSLSTRKNYVFRPFADQTLSALERRVVDRNETVSSSYAASFGYISRIASDQQILRTVGFAKKLYFGDADNDRPRFVAAEILNALAKSATDRFNALASELIPFVFFGRFDDAERVKQVFRETYDETTSGPRVISLYLEEILSLAREHLSSAKWTLKHASAKALAEAAQGIGASQGSISEAQADLIWKPLQEALAQKTWEGKAAILTGFVVFTEKVDQSWRSRHEKEMKIIALREARRRNKDYQAPALDCLGKIATALAYEDMLNEVAELTANIISETGEAMDVDEGDEGGDSKHTSTTNALIVANATAATFEALHLEKESGAQDLLARCSLSLDCAARALSLPSTTAHSNQLLAAIYESVKRLCHSMERHKSTEQLLNLIRFDDASSPGFVDRSLTLFPTNIAPMQEKPRTLRAEAISALVELMCKATRGPVPSSTALLSIVEQYIAEERSVPIRNILLSVQRRLTTSQG